MRKGIAIALVGLIGVTSAFAAAEHKKKWWGLSLGVFLPNSGEIKDRFSDVFFRVGVAPFEDRLTSKWRFIVDLNTIFANKDGNHLFAAPLTVGFTRAF